MDQYTVSAESLLRQRAFSVPDGAALEVTGVTEGLFAAVKAKVLHILGDAHLASGGLLSEVECPKDGRLFFPAEDFLKKQRFGFYDLIYIIHRLRDKDGCEWDKVQTHESIRSNAVEEAYELVDAINHKDLENMREETGDVLLQGAFHAVIAEGAGEYDVSDVVSEVCKKLIFRHPHVFGTVKATNAEEALAAWEKAKMAEKKQKNVTEKMTHVAETLPQTMRAAKVQKYAASVGFDFACAEDSAVKIGEEVKEFLAASPEEAELEAGDLLFAAINTVRLRGVNPEMALLRSTDKFVRRFAAVEQKAAALGIDVKTAGLDKLEELYQQVKSEE